MIVLFKNKLYRVKDINQDELNSLKAVYSFSRKEPILYSTFLTHNKSYNYCVIRENDIYYFKCQNKNKSSVKRKKQSLKNILNIQFCHETDLLGIIQLESQEKCNFYQINDNFFKQQNILISVNISLFNANLSSTPISNKINSLKINHDIFKENYHT